MGMRQRSARDRDETAAKTCAYCFHPLHVYVTGAWHLSPDLATLAQDGPLAVTVLYCRDDGCDCGVSPCPNCGSRWRRYFDDRRLVESCGRCEHEWERAVLA